MRKLAATACMAAALLLPVAPASAEERPGAGAIVRVTDCPPGYTGYVVQAWNEKRGWYDVVSFCIPFGP